MISSLVRAIRGPSRDPRMAVISRPLPRDLRDEQVLAALDLALRVNPDPAYLVETLRPALRTVTGRDFAVLDRSSRDVTGSYTRTSIMIRDGEVGLWPGYKARAYPLLAPSPKREEARAAIVAESAGAEAPARKPGWKPPPPLTREAPVPRPVGDAEAGATAAVETD